MLSICPHDPISPDVLPNASALTRRLDTVRCAGEGGSMLVAASMSALMQGCMSVDEARQWLVPLEEGQDCVPGGGSKTGGGWLPPHRHCVEPGDFALRGDVVDLFPASGEPPVRLDFFGDELESIRGIDLDSMASAERRSPHRCCLLLRRF